LLLIVCYNLVQHLVAGGVDFAFVRRPAPVPEEDTATPVWRLGLRPFLSSSFVLIAVLVLANAGASYWNIRLLASNHRRVVRAHEVLDHLQKTLSALRDAETSQRDYLLTGDPQTLAPYKAARVRIQQHMKLLQRKTRDDPEQQQRLPALAKRVIERLDALDAMVALRRDQGFEAARQAVLADREKEGLAELRQAMDDMEEHEEARLEQRTAESDARVARALATVVLLGCLLLVHSFLRRLESVRKRAQKGYRFSHAETDGHAAPLLRL
jgi:CHASE3 domain sensor protein